ncbi:MULTISPECIES: OmpW family protein [unclassified Novosphingobium]|jgi:outer membrane protein|uniref:OmpW/AlkL family protein n=1 Tax=unclassified Novosphingobium TaxID=2644732 RepID=UPI00061BBE46|nr:MULTISPECIES: OmpW family outer membrane protein [unclassified Novosphingobium]MBF5089352.1 OmpW family protein [Novosphingobium sp. NBM11]RQW44945.1 OmpW family protein [Novosphingobium sp. LASN5T]GAO56663.1 outer membrane protein W precursor [Novosphingobium sp. MD-1]
MKKVLAAALCAAMLTPLAATPAMAGSPDGKLQVKLLGTGVLPDGKITKVELDPLGLTTGANTKANDNVVPTLAVEYFFSPNVSVETICCFTQHHVSGTGTLAAATDIVGHVLILPATLTAKYHLPLPGGIKPYVGVGPSVFFYIDEKPGASIVPLGVTKVNMSNKLGVALQAGVDIPVNKNGLGVSLDAKKYFMDTTAHFYAGSTEVLRTKHSLDPWVISAGLSYRF